MAGACAFAKEMFEGKRWRGAVPAFDHKWFEGVRKRRPQLHLAVIPTKVVSDSGEQPLATLKHTSEHFDSLDDVFDEFNIVHPRQVGDDGLFLSSFFLFFFLFFLFFVSSPSLVRSCPPATRRPSRARKAC